MESEVDPLMFGFLLISEESVYEKQYVRNKYFQWFKQERPFDAYVEKDCVALRWECCGVQML